MRKALYLLVVSICLGLITVSADAQRVRHKRHHPRPKNEITRIRTARKKDHTLRQVTVDPKKSPGKHADNLSKNVNHEMNRESKDVNRFFQGKKKKR
ncbi:MAG TPA: hypothetical protein VF898_14000 [Chloroflexota bacterium]